MTSAPARAPPSGGTMISSHGDQIVVYNTSPGVSSHASRSARASFSFQPSGVEGMHISRAPHDNGSRHATTVP